MIVEVKVPTPGESITKVEISEWFVVNGDLVHKNQELAEIESDKATLSLTAPESGKVELLAKVNDVVKVNSVVCKIDTSVAVPDEPIADVEKTEDKASMPKKSVEQSEAKPAKESTEAKSVQQDTSFKSTPLAREKMETEKLHYEEVLNGLKKLSSKDVDAVLSLRNGEYQEAMPQNGERTIDRKRMSQLRKQLSKRLVQVKNETAMLTTFNEVDMSALMDLRKRNQTAFTKKFGYKIGLISFFMKAAALALKKHPMVNSMVDGDEILTPSYVDISIAIQSPKGLMVPVIRNVHLLPLAEIEKQIQSFAEKAQSGKITLEEMTGGTFTLTNGGVFGSMLSTPLINPPQSAIIGMHNINDRPVAIDGKVEIRPMMYVALSYDHRIIDGKDSVGFLKDVKGMIENPVSLLLSGSNPEEALLGL